MRISTKLVRTITLVAAGAALVAVVPAQANVGIGTDANLDLSRPTRNALPLVQLTQGTRNLDLRTRNVAVSCEGVGVGDAVSTEITQCSIKVNGTIFKNERIALPGPAAAIATFSQIVPVGSVVQGCTTLTVRFTDPLASVTRSACTGSEVAVV